MASVTASTGLVSGINYADIINQLMALEQRPVNTLQTRLDNVNQQKLAYTDLVTRLQSLKLNSTTLKKPSSFQNASTTSSDENVLTATASTGAALGSYQFQVARLVTTQQSVSRGFTDFDSAKVGEGKLTIEVGGGDLTQDNPLSDLRGGDGVRRGVFKLTDRGGNTAVIDTTSAVTLNDVVKKINTNLDISVRASIDGDKLVLTDLTGKTTSNLIVQDVGDGHAAADLGLVGNVASDTLTGTDINYVGAKTSLTQLNDGRGIRNASTGNDIEITLGDGSTVDVAFTTSKTVGDVIDAINTAGAGKLKAEIVAGSNGIRLTDQTGGGQDLVVANLGDSHAATDLGIETAGTAGTVIDGSPVLAGLGTVLVSSLNGGKGLALGTISVQSRAAGSATDIDLSGAKTVADIIKTINGANAGVKAAVSDSGNGIQITDTSGGTGNLVIGDTSGTTADDLGISGTFDTTTTAVKGKNLQRQWVSENTLLSTYNGGKGVSQGKFKITNSAGKSVTIDLSSGKDVRLEDVISKINIRDMGVTASINDNGDGLLLTDTSGGSGTMKVEDLDGSAAADLNIKGSATSNVIDGSMEKTIDVTANDTLTTLQKKINDLDWGVTAQIISDGSSTAPYRLALNATNSGVAGRVVLDGGTTALDTRTLVQAQDAAVFVGGANADQPLLITSSKNQVAGIVKGVNINLHGVSDKPVTLNVTGNIDNVVDQVKQFTQTFNDMVDKVTELTKWDSTNNTGGLLLGDSTVQQIQTDVYNMLLTVNVNSGKYRVLADVGVTLGDGAKITFDEDKFRAAYADNPDAVEKLFSESDTVTKDDKTVTTTPGIAFAMETAISKLIDPANGVVTQQNNTLDDRSTQFQTRIDQLNALIDQKRTRLQTQFANLESTLSTLQSQQQSISQIKSIAA